MNQAGKVLDAVQVMTGSILNTHASKQAVTDKNAYKAIVTFDCK